MRATLIVLTLITLSAPAQEKTGPPEDLKKLEGTWEVTSLEVDGMVQPKDKTPKQIVITADRLKMAPQGSEISFKIDPSKSPKWITLSLKKDDTTTTIPGIYQLKGDELWLCISVAEKGKAFEGKRPEDFETKGKLVSLFKAQRAKNP